MPTIALAPFVLITFAVSWGTIGFYIFFPEQAVAWFGEISGSHPAFFLATWAPAIAAFAVVLGYAGVAGFQAYLSRLLLWRCSIGWAVFLLIGLPLSSSLPGHWSRAGPSLRRSPPKGPGPCSA